MPVTHVWVVTRRLRRQVVGVTGSVKGAGDLVYQDVVRQATAASLDPADVTVWHEHGEVEPGQVLTRASWHVASRRTPTWTVTYDGVRHPVYQRHKPRRPKPAPVLEPVLP